MAKVEIHTNGSRGDTHILVDGQRVKGVKRFTIAAAADGDEEWPPTVTLEIVATELVTDLDDSTVIVTS